MSITVGDTVQTINTLCPISGTVVEIYDNLIVISDDELTKICDDIYQTLMGAFVAQMMEIA